MDKPSNTTETFLQQLRRLNVERAHKGFGHQPDLNDWTILEWAAALAGEAGEVAGACKAVSRHRVGFEKGKPLEEVRGEIADEIGDVLTYLDLLAFVAGIDLEEALIRKFNKVSDKVNYGPRLIGSAKDA